jgi:DNA polymerase-4
VKFSYLIRGTQQLDLFDNTPKLVNLYQACDNMRNRYGFDAVKRSVAMKDQERRPPVGIPTD